MCKKEVWGQNVLDFVECNDVHGLDVVFEANNLLFEIIHHNLIVFNDTSDLKLLDTVATKVSSCRVSLNSPNLDQLSSAPEKTVHGDWADWGLQLLHISLIVPWLDVHNDVGLGNDFALLGLLLGLLLVVSGNAFSLDSLSLGVFFFIIVRTEEIDVIIFLLLSSGRSWSCYFSWTAFLLGLWLKVIASQ